MTLSMIGGHFTANGIGQGYPSRVCLSIQGNGLNEQHPDTIVLFRDVTIYMNGPGDLHTKPNRRTIEYAQFWYDQLRPIWQANAHRVNYFTITNELGGSNPDHILDHIAFESHICALAAADGLKCAVGKLAGDSPDWNTNLWEELYAPFIVQMWDRYGAIYARHVYGGNLIDSNGNPTDDPPGNPQRAIFEADHLRRLGYGGGMVLAECGLDGGYGVADYGRFQAQALGYEAALRAHDDIIIGLCWWKCGNEVDESGSGFDSDYTEHIKMLWPSLDTSLPKWEGKESEDMTPKDCDLYLDLGRFVHLLPQDTTDDEIATIARKFNASKQSFVYSHDDAELIIAHGRGQNSEGKRVSEVKIWEPQRFSFDVTGYFASKGYMYTVGYFAGEPEPSNPLTGLKLGYLFEYQYSDNYSPFNAPRDYDGDGIFDDRHEGLDADVIGGNVDNRVNVLCVYDGTVDRSLDSTGNYGKYVRVAHVRNGSTFYTRYCHLDTRLVQVGAVIKKGDPVGEVGDTGYVSGEHVHFNLEVPGYGLSGYVVADVVDPYPYLPKDNMSLSPVGSTPPPSQTVDTLRYFVPSGQYGRKIVMRVGNGTQPMQLEKRANDVILRKGDGNWINGIRYQDSEQWRVVNGQVQKGIDTSDAGNGGRDAYDLAWAQWIPQHVEVGKTYHSTPTVRRFDRTTCAIISSNPASDYLYIRALVPQWTSPANASIVLSNVLIVEWRSGTPDLSVPPTETYYFCKEIGYVGWGSHFINELADGQAPLTGKLDCAQ